MSSASKNKKKSGKQKSLSRQIVQFSYKMGTKSVNVKTVIQATEELSDEALAKFAVSQQNIVRELQGLPVGNTPSQKPQDAPGASEGAEDLKARNLASPRREPTEDDAIGMPEGGGDPAALPPPPAGAAGRAPASDLGGGGVGSKINEMINRP